MLIGKIFLIIYIKLAQEHSFVFSIKTNLLNFFIFRKDRSDPFP